MTQQSPPGGRRGLDLIFGIFLVNGLVICAAILAALAAWAGQGDDAGMGAFALGMSAIVPSIVAWIASGVRALMRPRVADVQLGAALATLHLLLWAALVVLGSTSGGAEPPGWLIATPIVGTACYGIAVTVLALRWFFVRRRAHSTQAPA
jgi:hypothetical protein